MSKKLLSAMLALFLIGVASSPSLFAVMDAKVEISLFENPEEEKENRLETQSDMESLLSAYLPETKHSQKVCSKKYSGYNCGYYPMFYLSLHSPPPEMV